MPRWPRARSSTRARAVSARRASPPRSARRCAAAGLRTVVLSHRPGAQPRRRARDAARRRADRGRPRALRPGGPGPGRDGAPLGGGAGWLGELLTDRGVDRISAEELTVPPGMDELFSLLQIKRHHESGRVRRRDRRLRADRRDAAAAVVPRRLHAGGWRRSSRRGASSSPRRGRSRATMLDMSLPGEAVFDEFERLASNLVAMNEILRDRSRDLGPAGDEPGPDGRQGGDADVHLPQPLRLPDRRRRGQPVLPPEAAEGYFAGWREAQQEHMELVRSGVRAGAGADRAVLRRRGDRRARCSTCSATSCSASTPSRTCCTRTFRSELTPTATAGATLRLPLPFAERGDIDAQEDRPRGDRAGRRPEADDHAAPGPGRL